MPDTLNIAPPAHMVQTALDHCNIPLVVLDDHTVNVAELTGDTLQTLLSAVVNMAMVKHVEDTMIFPSNANRLREVRDELSELRMAGKAEHAEWIDELRETLLNVATNLTADRS